MRVPDVVAIGVALGGMILFFIGRFETRGMSGNAMALVSSFFFASMILALRRERVAANAAIVWGNVVLALALLPAVYPSFALTRRSAIVLVLLGVFQIAAPYALFVRGLRYVSATQASLTGMIEPVANPIWVFLFLGERPAGPSILGGAIVLGAIAWHTWVATPAVEMPAPD
jgi:drug/metabolite transporter (DMT)-like permease